CRLKTRISGFVNIEFVLHRKRGHKKILLIRPAACLATWRFPPRIEVGIASQIIWATTADWASIRIKPRKAQGKGWMPASKRYGSIGGRVAHDKFLNQELRKSRRVVPYDAVFLEQVIEQTTNTYALQIFDIYTDRLGAALAITPRHFRRDALVACDHPVDEFAAGVIV